MDNGLRTPPDSSVVDLAGPADGGRSGSLRSSARERSLLLERRDGLVFVVKDVENGHDLRDAEHAVKLGG